MRFRPSFGTRNGRPLQREDPLVRADFVRQHMRQGWTLNDAEARYKNWVDEGLEAEPMIEHRLHLMNDWIIERLVRGSNRAQEADVYEPWSGYSMGMSYEQAVRALEECCRRWPTKEFRIRPSHGLEQRG